MVRDILHELGFSRVRSQVESREIHVLTAKVVDKTFVNCENTLDVRVMTAKADDEKNKMRPYVTVGYMVTTRRTGKFEHVICGHYEHVQIKFKNKQQLEEDIKEVFFEKGLNRYLPLTSKTTKIKHPKKKTFTAAEAGKAVKLAKHGYLTKIVYPKENSKFEQLDLFAASAEQKQ